jgi:glutaredoxin
MKTVLSSWRMLIILLALIMVPVSCSVIMQGLDDMSTAEEEMDELGLQQIEKPILVTTEQKSPIVIMYSTSWCTFCKVAKRFLDEMGVSYLEKNMNNPEQYQELLDFAKKTGYKGELNAVPLFIIKEKILVGFNKKEILCLLGRTRCYTIDFIRSKTELD